MQGPTPDGQARRRSRRPATSCTLCHKRKIRCNRARPCSNCLRSKTGASGCAYENDAPNQSQVPPSVSSSDQTQHASDQAAQPQSQYLTPSSSGISTQKSTGFPSMSGSLADNSWTQPPKPASASGRSSHGTEALRLQLRVQQLESQLSNQSQSIPRRSPALLSSPAVSSSPAPTTVRASAMDADVEIISSQLGGTFHIHSTRDTFLGQDQPLIANGLSFKTRLLGQSHWAVSTAHLARPHQISRGYVSVTHSIY